jgi:hypothetical protein
MRVPAEVRQALSLPDSGGEAALMPGRWPSDDVGLLVVGSTGVVVKRWIGPEREARGCAEALMLVRLAERGFTAVARPVALGGSWWMRSRSPAALWTAQELVPGEVPSVHEIGAGLGERLGTLLGAFHLAAADPGPTTSAQSRLLRSDRWLTDDIRPLGPGRRVVAALRQAVSEHLGTLTAMPYCHIHGDVRLDNMVATPDRIALIDLEFTRVDLRLLDLASLAGGVRSAAGELSLLPLAVLEPALDAYHDAVAGTGLAMSGPERASLPFATAAFFLLVLHDLMRTHSPHVPDLFGLLESILQWIRRR